MEEDVWLNVSEYRLHLIRVYSVHIYVYMCTGINLITT